MPCLREDSHRLSSKPCETAAGTPNLQTNGEDTKQSGSPESILSHFHNNGFVLLKGGI